MIKFLIQKLASKYAYSYHKLNFLQQKLITEDQFYAILAWSMTEKLTKKEMRELNER